MIKKLWKSWQNARANKRQQEEMEENRRLAELEDFCPVGDRFFYLDLVMVCKAHGHGNPDVGWINGIQAEYVDDHGIVQNIFFYYCQLETLRKENERGKENRTRISVTG